LERAELGGDIRAIIAGNLIAGRLRLTEGDIVAAANYLDQVRPLLESAQFSHWISRFERFQLEFWLAQDKIQSAVEWTNEMLQSEAQAGKTESEVVHLSTARVLITSDGEISQQRALALLESLVETAEADGRIGIQIEAMALQALAYWQRNDPVVAMTFLERALRLAEPEGYVRTFADLGLSMARLLQEARSRNVLPDYVEVLLAAFGADITFPISTQKVLPDPLTPREQEVLELLAAGLTNREIADLLVISPQTVKKHADRIYSKLGVHSRTEAAAKARELNLLG
jgi:LuxR family maltose regulon positive regulatory protein